MKGRGQASQAEQSFRLQTDTLGVAGVPGVMGCWVNAVETLFLDCIERVGVLGCVRESLTSCASSGVIYLGTGGTQVKIRAWMEPGNSAAGFHVGKIQLGLFPLGNDFGFLLFAAWVTVSWVGDCNGVFLFISFLPSQRAL